jgi:hypothetical protein
MLTILIGEGEMRSIGTTRNYLTTDWVPWIVYGYYTDKYKSEAEGFMESLVEWAIPFRVDEVESLGSWQENTRMKPSLVRGVLREEERAVLYVDVDARFNGYPSLIGGYKALGVDVSYYHRNEGDNFVNESLSGTVFVNNTTKGLRFMDKWVELCDVNPTKWDQVHLDEAVRGSRACFRELLPEYCTIFDSLINRDPGFYPVIEHFQASRRLR